MCSKEHYPEHGLLPALQQVRYFIEIIQSELEHSDFELAPRNAWKSKYPNVEIDSCLFHYAQVNISIQT